MEGFLCGEKKEKTLEFHSVIIFWTVWKERNRLAFRGGGLNIFLYVTFGVGLNCILVRSRIPL